MTSLLDMEAEAELNLPKDYWNWVSGGDGEGVTVRRNREAFQGISVRPRALVDTANKDMSTSMLGERIDFPVFASPAGGQWLAHPDGEVAVAGAACSKGMLMVVPTGAHKTLEEIAKATTAPLWFQLYHLTDEITEYILPRVESAGYSAVCLTVRGPGTIGGTMNRHGKYSPRGDLAWGDLGEVPHLRKLIDNLDRSVHRGLTWDRMEWLRSLTGLPIVIKEILTAEDARRCVDHGASGIVVSNHGGRSFDAGQASIEVLPSIVDEVGDEVEVYLDSGVRSGMDVFKALALGAKSVGVGRPVFWGLALGGRTGVTAMFEILRDEFSRAMAVCGCLSVGDIDESLIVLPKEW